MLRFGLLAVVAVLSILLIFAVRRMRADRHWLVPAADIEVLPEVLGEGKFGAVVRARFRSLDAAVKILHAPASSHGSLSRHGSIDSGFSSQETPGAAGGASAAAAAVAAAIVAAARGADAATTTSPSATLPIRSSSGPTRCMSMLCNRYRDEMKILVKLHHPCIVTCLGLVLDGPTPMIVMELMDCSLYTFIRRYSAELDREVRGPIIHDILQGMAPYYSQNKILKSRPSQQNTKGPMKS